MAPLRASSWWAPWIIAPFHGGEHSSWMRSESQEKLGVGREVPGSELWSSAWPPTPPLTLSTPITGLRNLRMHLGPCPGMNAKAVVHSCEMDCGLAELEEVRSFPFSSNLFISGPRADHVWVATQNLAFGGPAPGSDGGCPRAQLTQ